MILEKGHFNLSFILVLQYCIKKTVSLLLHIVKPVLSYFLFFTKQLLPELRFAMKVFCSLYKLKVFYA